MTLNSDKTNKNAKFSTNLQLTAPTSNTKNTATTITTSSSIRSNKNIYVNNESYGRPTTSTTYNSSNEGNNSVNVSSDTIGTTITTTSNNAATDNGSSRNNHSYLDGKDSGFNYTNDRQNINRSSNNGNNRKFGSSVDPGFGFSPKSVLRGSTVVGCSSLGLGYGTVLETEPQRCRRTDGKKWRCGWDVIPEQKYCGRHMHRGVKKTILPSTPVTVAAAPPPPFAVPKKVDDRVKLNTNLSISIVQSPQQICDDRNSTSGSSSDATTITDESTGVSHILALST